MKELIIREGALDTEEIFALWYNEYRGANYGAFITFVGIVRDEDGIEGLSFDIYLPILEAWFGSWQERARAKNALVVMAHSKGDVPLHKSSFVAATLSPRRKVALALINEFVEDFKANAPIWKYDLRGGKRVYAKERSTMLEGAGILA